MADEHDIDAIWTDIEAWLREHAPDRAAELRGPASEQVIDELEKRVGHSLPAAYIRSLRIHDGNTDLSDYTYLSAEDAGDSWSALCARKTEGPYADREVDDPEGGVIEPVWWSPAWVPFAKDSGGNYLCLDLAPGPRGIVGQVVRFERAAGPGPTGFPSFGAWLSDYRDGLLGGSFVADEDGFIQDVR